MLRAESYSRLLDVEDGLVPDPAAAGALLPGAALYGCCHPVPVAIFTYRHEKKDPREWVKDDAATSPHRSSVRIHPERSRYYSSTCQSLRLTAPIKGCMVNI